MAVNDYLDLVNGTKFYDMESNREMLIKNWSDGQPWLFSEHQDGHWVSLRAATDEDLELLHAAYEERLAIARSLKGFDQHEFEGES